MLPDLFLARMNAASRKLILSLAPRLDQLPPEIQYFDEPLLPYGKAVIAATKDIVSGYMFNFPAYLTIGAAGVIALERTLAYASTLGKVTILDGDFSSADYAFAFTHGELWVDAVTVSHMALQSAFIQAGMTAIGKGAGISENGLAIVGDQLHAGSHIWQVIQVDQIARGSLNFEEALRSAF